MRIITGVYNQGPHPDRSCNGKTAALKKKKNASAIIIIIFSDPNLLNEHGLHYYDRWQTNCGGCRSWG